MTTEEIVVDEIRKILDNYGYKTESPIDNETKFDSLNLDSLDSVELVMNLEKRLDLFVPDHHLNTINKRCATVGTITKIIEELQK